MKSIRLHYLLLFKLCFLIISFNGHAKESVSKPVIFNYTESVRPGETVGLQGVGFGIDGKIHLMYVKGTEKVLTPQRELTVISKSAIFIAAQIPENIPMGLYAIWISNGNSFSKPVLINLAREMAFEFDEIMPKMTMRIFGKNLYFEGTKCIVKFVHPKTGVSTDAYADSHDFHELTVRVPASLLPSEYYNVYINNGYGGKYGNYLCEERVLVRKIAPDYLESRVPWGADFSFVNNLCNVKTDHRLKQHAKGDGINNDRNAIQEAINQMALRGGGTVYLPSGIYKLIYDTGYGIIMRSNVILKGDGPDKTIIRYGYGQPFTTERVKSSYGWTLGWPDSRTEGMALVWPGFITASGLMGLCLENINESGHFVHTIKNMPEGGSKIILKNCKFEMDTGWGLAMVNIDHFLMTDCEVHTSSMDVRGINAPTRTWPLDFKNSSYCNIRNNKIYYNAGRFGSNGCHHAIFENNLFVRNGDYQSKGETGGINFDYAMNVVIQKNRFLLTGETIKRQNQGETILSQGGNPHQQTIGIITEATESTVTDIKQEWQDFTDRVSTDWQYAIHPMNYIIAIVDGNGVGQWRTIIGNNDTILTIDRPWDVIPDRGSKYVITQWSVHKGIIRDNTLKDNHQGIMLYCGGSDIVIVGNELNNSGGIYLRSDQRSQNKRYNLTWNISVTDNKIINTNGLRSAHVAMFHVKVKNDNSDIFGIGTLGIEMRRNIVQASIPNVDKAGGSSGLGAEGFFNKVSCEKSDNTPCNPANIGIVGTIMENNVAINTANAYQISAGVTNTVIIPGKTENIGHLLNDSGSVNTFITKNSIKK
jgi:hypothetical protein